MTALLCVFPIAEELCMWSPAFACPPHRKDKSVLNIFLHSVGLKICTTNSLIHFTLNTARIFKCSTFFPLSTSKFYFQTIHSLISCKFNKHQRRILSGVFLFSHVWHRTLILPHHPTHPKNPQRRPTKLLMPSLPNTWSQRATFGKTPCEAPLPPGGDKRRKND